MDRLKTFLIYALMLVGFYIFSNIVIFIALNSNYNTIYPTDIITDQIEVTRAEATKVNGRIRGTITNTAENNLNGKYIKIDLYSEEEKLKGTKYLAISEFIVGTTESFEVYFKANDIEYYNITIVDEIDETETDEIFLSEDMKTYAIIGALIFLVVW